MKHFLDIASYKKIVDYFDSLKGRYLVIYSPTSMKLVGIAPENNRRFVNAHLIGKNAANIEALCRSQQFDVVVGLGGGSPIDIAKYAASLLHCKFVCMPTMLSTNAFATNKVALMREGRKITIDAKLPDEIIVDTDVILKAGVLNVYGLCDILSIHTALFDWMLADRAGIERINQEIYRASSRLLDQSIRLARRLGVPTAKDIAMLFELIGESGHITNIYGSGRPESGSEHIFAKEFERRIDVPHGISITIGLSIMSRLQNNYSTDVNEALRNIGMMRAVQDYPDLRRVTEETLASLSSRPDRYTILNEAVMTHAQIKQLVARFFGRVPEKVA